jgi:hypothetical protein
MLVEKVIGSGQLPMAERLPWLELMGSGQLPMDSVVPMGSGQLPMALTDRTAGAAAEKASAPAKATEAAIFLNMWVPQYESETRFGYITKRALALVDIHCKMACTETVKHLVQRLSGIRRYPWGTDSGRNSERNGSNAA